MDGLDNRGQVIVIGATNRPDHLDSALRRPGRFDRELAVTLPDRETRRAILDIHSKSWTPPLGDELKDWVALQSVGYCGADLKALCAETALCALKRRFPQVYRSTQKLLIDPSKVKVEKLDFVAAMRHLSPASHRGSITQARPLPPHLRPLRSDSLSSILRGLTVQFPLYKFREPGDQTGSVALADATDPAETLPQTHRPRLLIAGASGLGQRHVAGAVIHALEGFPTFTLDMAALLADSAGLTQALVSQVTEARRAAPSVIFIPNLHLWTPQTEGQRTEEVPLLKDLYQLLVTLLDDLPESLPVLVLATATTDPRCGTELAAPLVHLVSHSAQVEAPPRPADLARFVAVRGQGILRLPTDTERAEFIEGLWAMMLPDNVPFVSLCACFPQPLLPPRYATRYLRVSTLTSVPGRGCPRWQRQSIRRRGTTTGSGGGRHALSERGCYHREPAAA